MQFSSAPQKESRGFSKTMKKKSPYVLPSNREISHCWKANSSSPIGFLACWLFSLAASLRRAGTGWGCVPDVSFGEHPSSLWWGGEYLTYLTPIHWWSHKSWLNTTTTSPHASAVLGIAGRISMSKKPYQAASCIYMRKLMVWVGCIWPRRGKENRKHMFGTHRYCGIKRVWIAKM